MSTDQLQWLLLIISQAPIQDTAQARIKAAWLEEISARLDEVAKE